MEESIQLLLRLRPPRSQDHVFWTAKEDKVLGEAAEFNADAVFGPSSTNQDIFKKNIHNMVKQCCDGYNTAVMAYGQSGAGKTHTLLGGTKEDGLVSYVTQHLFEEVELQQKSGGRSFLVQLQIMELYCEKIRDLLVDQSSSTDRKIMEANNIPRVTDLKTIPITSAKQALQIISEAQLRRVVAATELNDQSSRSHAIVQLSIESSLTIDDNVPNDGKTRHKCRRSVMNIVDLAGSENTGSSSGIRAKEGNVINLSLMTLTKVINQLTEKTGQVHISYRDSKLTRLLKPCLGGNSSTLIICCIDPQNKDESHRTLKFSERMKLVTARVKVNEDEEGGQLTVLLGEIERLKRELTDVKEAKAKEEEEEKRSRLAELRAQFIDGSADSKPEKPRFFRRQTICAPRMASYGMKYSPPMKKSRPFTLSKITDDERKSDPAKAILSCVTARGSECSSITTRRSNEVSTSEFELQELEDLRHKNFEFELNARRQAEELTSLKKLHEEEYEELTRQLVQIKEEKTALQERVNTSEDLALKEKEVAVKFATLSQEKERLIAENTEMRDKSEKAEIEKVSLQILYEQETESWNREKKELFERLNHGEMSAFEREKLISRIEELADTVSNSKKELEETKTLLDDQRVLTEQLKERLKSLEFDLKEAESLLNQGSKIASETKKKAEEAYSNLHTETSNKISNLWDEVEQLKSQLTMSLDSVSLEKEKENEILKEQCSALKSDLKLSEENCQQIRVQVVAEVEGAVSNKMHEYEETIRQLQSNVANLENLQTALLREHESHDKLVDDNSKMKTRLEECEALCKERGNQLNILNGRLKQLSIKEIEVLELSKEVRELKHQAIIKDGSITYWKERNLEVSQEMRGLYTQISSLNEKCDHLTKKNAGELEQFEKTLASEKGKFEADRKRHDTIKTELENKVERVMDFSRDKSLKLLEVQSDLSQTRRELERYKDQFRTAVEEELEPVREQCRSLEDSVNQLKTALEESNSSNTSLKNELQTQKIVADKAMKKLLEAQSSQISATIFSTGDDQLKRENTALKRKLVDLEDEIEALQSKEKNRRPTVQVQAEDSEKSRSQLASISNKLFMTESCLGKITQEKNELGEKLATTESTLKKKVETLNSGIEQYNSLLAEHKTLVQKYKKLKEHMNSN